MTWLGDRSGGLYRLAGLLYLGLGFVMLPACNSIGGGQREGQPAASAVRDPVLQDIPKPSGFLLVNDRSFGVFSGKVRIARCEYDGSSDTSAVKRFYEEYMPSAGFELRRWTLDGGVFNLHFESNTEICVVRVLPRKWRKTGLVVEISPKPQGPTERDSKPPMRRPQ
ncbi:MAG: hypothetical protein ACE5I3_05845 [Phycisphaerae bacterium]